MAEGHGSGGGNSASTSGTHGSGGGNAPTSTSTGPSGYASTSPGFGGFTPETPAERAKREADKAAREAASAAAAQKATEDYARTQAGIASQGAAQETAGYAQAQGLNPAQAALLGGQTAGKTYGGAYGSNLFSKLGLDMQKYGIDRNYQAQKDAMNQQNSNNMFNMFGTALSGGALLFSDENLKEDIKDGYGILDKVSKAVDLKTYRMKDGDGGTKAGVMAQDLEKTPLAYTVKETPEGKAVDTRELSTANTGMISELSKKVDELYSFLKGAGNGPARAS